MNDVTRISADGQVSLPQDVRDRLALAPGTELEIVETGGGVLLRRLPQAPAHRRETLTMEEAVARLKEIIRYDGPVISIEDMRMSIADEAGRRDTRGKE